MCEVFFYAIHLLEHEVIRLNVEEDCKDSLKIIGEYSILGS